MGSAFRLMPRSVLHPIPRLTPRAFMGAIGFPASTPAYDAGLSV
jgi:hypothetical protein